MELLSESIKIVRGLAPDADRFAATVESDRVNLGLYERALILVDRGTGSTGTQTLTVQSYAANSGGSATAIPFKYRRCDFYPLTDTLGAYAQATASGFTTVAGGDDCYVIEVQAADLPEGNKYISLKSVEGTDAAVDGSVVFLLSNPRYQGANLPSAL